MKSKWLLATGCSLTWGSELTTPNESLPSDKDLAWPAHLGKLLDAEIVSNKAWPGKSNGSIFRTAMEEIVSMHKEHGSDGLVVIQWSGDVRLEVVNPFVWDIVGFNRKLRSIKHHPGQEGPYLNVLPADMLSMDFQKQFVGLAHFFVNHWSHDFYQQELKVTYSVALTSLAKKLGVKILQFNGIDELISDVIPDHAKNLTDLIGEEFFKPFDRTYSFWPHYRHEIKSRGTKMFPKHPELKHHIDWANTLYNYLKATQPII